MTVSMNLHDPSGLHNRRKRWRQRLTALTKLSRNWPQKARTRTKCDD